MPSTKARGTQSIERALDLLRQIASLPEEGPRLLDLQRLSGLTKPTVHRLLQTMSHYDLVVQDKATRRYSIGPEIGLLALSISNSLAALQTIATPELKILAESTGDTAFLMARSGNYGICIDRHLGPYPIKVLTVDVGNRRPLPIGAGGLAMLATLPKPDVADIFDMVHDSIRNFTQTNTDKLLSAVNSARTLGYAFSDGHVMPEVRGLGIAICDHNNKLLGALGISAIRERITPARIKTIIPLMQRARRTIERGLRDRAARSAS